MNDNAVTIRRARISNYISETDDVSKKDFKIISDELGIPYETVRKDVDWIQRAEDKVYQNYNLEGLREKALDKIIQFEKMIKKIDDDFLNEDSDVEGDTLLKAIDTKSKLLNNLHQLEHNGIGIINLRVSDSK